MYWSDWSYGKERMNSSLEKLLEPPKQKRSCILHYFSCFRENKDIINEYPDNRITKVTFSPDTK